MLKTNIHARGQASNRGVFTIQIFVFFKQGEDEFVVCESKKHGTESAMWNGGTMYNTCLNEQHGQCGTSHKCLGGRSPTSLSTEYPSSPLIPPLRVERKGEGA